METVPELIIPTMGHFRFVRALEGAVFGEGNWICVRKYRSLPPNTILPFDLQDQLSTLARERGIAEAHNFRRNLPKPERKPVSTRSGERTPKAKDGKLSMSGASLFGEFNPFKSQT